MSAFFFFNDTATTEIYTLSLHDALPICRRRPAPIRTPEEVPQVGGCPRLARAGDLLLSAPGEDRKSTRLNSSHSQISYAVFCLIKKNALTAAATQLERSSGHVTFAQAQA